MVKGERSKESMEENSIALEEAIESAYEIVRAQVTKNWHQVVLPRLSP